jgi:hypothetical protein
MKKQKNQFETFPEHNLAVINCSGDAKQILSILFEACGWQVSAKKPKKKPCKKTN